MTYKRKEIIGDCTLYLGDCLEVMPTLGKVDAVVTDPPYGINYKYNLYNDTHENLVFSINSLMKFIGTTKRSLVLCGITQISFYPKPEWISCITWDTTGQYGKNGYTQWMPALFYGHDVSGFGNVEGLVTKSDVLRISGGAGVGFARNENIDHPCPKPLNIMNWCVSRFSLKGETILDPFMGSGTTGVACVKLGRKFIGIELDEKYFDIACKRIEEAYRQPDMFIEPPKKIIQETLL